MILERVSSGLSSPAKLSGFVLVLVNMIPLVGVIVWDWNVFQIAMLYWSENIVIGLLHAPRILLAKGGESPLSKPEKIFSILFFFVHFGLFCAGHGFFVFTLLGKKDFWEYPFISLALMLIEVLRTIPLVFVLFFASHLFSFFWNYVWQREYRETDPREQFSRPYHRIIILHVAILFGAFAVEMMDSPMVLLLIFIAGKTALDLGIHLYFHGKKS